MAGFTSLALAALTGFGVAAAVRRGGNDMNRRNDLSTALGRSRGDRPATGEARRRDGGSGGSQPPDVSRAGSEAASEAQRAARRARRRGVGGSTVMSRAAQSIVPDAGARLTQTTLLGGRRRY